jgi:hypothetical protein
MPRTAWMPRVGCDALNMLDNPVQRRYSPCQSLRWMRLASPQIEMGDTGLNYFYLQGLVVPPYRITVNNRGVNS